MKGLGQTLQINTGSYTDIAKLQNFTPPEGTREEIPTNYLLSGASTSDCGRIDWGEVSGTAIFVPGDATHAELYEAFEDGLTRSFKELYTAADSTTTAYTWSAWVKKYALNEIQDTENVELSFTLRVSGERTAL